jgi:hypothetical protein
MDMSYWQKQVPGLIRNFSGRLRRPGLTYDTGVEAMTRPPLVRPEWVSSDELNPKAIFRPCPRILTPITHRSAPRPMGVNM